MKGKCTSNTIHSCKMTNHIEFHEYSWCERVCVETLVWMMLYIKMLIVQSHFRTKIDLGVKFNICMWLCVVSSFENWGFIEERSLGSGYFIRIFRQNFCVSRRIFWEIWRVSSRYFDKIFVFPVEFFEKFGVFHQDISTKFLCFQ